MPDPIPCGGRPKEAGLGYLLRMQSYPDLLPAALVMGVANVPALRNLIVGSGAFLAEKEQKFPSPEETSSGLGDATECSSSYFDAATSGRAARYRIGLPFFFYLKPAVYV